MVIYGLIDPETLQLRYIGQTARPVSHRLGQHLRTAGKQTTPKVNAWLRSVIASGRKPQIVELDVCSSKNELDESEVHWIAYFRYIGADLVNVTPGGSSRRGWKHTEEQKEKWRTHRRGANHCLYGKKHSPERRKENSEKQKRWYETHQHHMLGKHLSHETKRKISASRTGVPTRLTEAGLLRRVEATKRLWNDPNHREKMSRAGLSSPSAKPIEFEGRFFTRKLLADYLSISKSRLDARLREARDQNIALTREFFAVRPAKGGRRKQH